MDILRDPLWQGVGVLLAFFVTLCGWLGPLSVRLARLGPTRRVIAGCVFGVIAVLLCCTQLSATVVAAVSPSVREGAVVVVVAFGVLNGLLGLFTLPLQVANITFAGKRVWERLRRYLYE